MKIRIAGILALLSSVAFAQERVVVSSEQVCDDCTALENGLSEFDGRELIWVQTNAGAVTTYLRTANGFEQGVEFNTAPFLTQTAGPYAQFCNGTLEGQEILGRYDCEFVQFLEGVILTQTDAFAAIPQNSGDPQLNFIRLSGISRDGVAFGNGFYDGFDRNDPRFPPNLGNSPYSVCFDANQPAASAFCRTPRINGNIDGAWVISSISEDGNILVGSALVEVGFRELIFRPTFVSESNGVEGFLGFGTQGLAVEVSSSPFGQNTVVYQEEAGWGFSVIDNSGNVIRNELIPQAVDVYRITSEGIVYRTGEGGCAVLSPGEDGSVVSSTNIGADCVGGTSVGDVVSYLERGSAVLVRTEAFTDEEEPTVENVASAFTVCRISGRAGVCQRNVAEEFGISSADVRTANRLTSRFDSSAIVLITGEISELPAVRGRAFRVAARDIRAVVTEETGLRPRQVWRRLNNGEIRRIARLLERLGAN